MTRTHRIALIFLGLLPLPRAAMAQDAAATGISRAFNPAISVNSLFAAMASSEDPPLDLGGGLRTGFQLQDFSLEMTSNVDMYLQAKAALSAEGGRAMAVEEAYVSTLRMPIPVNLRAGKMLNTFGQHNLYHAHHMAFAEPPLVHESVFGPDLNEIGVEASYLLPLPWYGDLTAGWLNGDNPHLFGGTRQGDFGALLHLDNLWDLSDHSALRIGGSWLSGRKTAGHAPDAAPRTGLSETWGVDFQWKWKPLRYGRYRSGVIQGEYIRSTIRENGKSTRPLHGFFVQALRQFRLRWWLQARYDWLERPSVFDEWFGESEGLPCLGGETHSCRRWSLAAAFVPTEFSAFRLQFNRIDACGKREHQAVLQMNVTIGSHPAHKY